jgi:hypothetical protein
MIAFVLGLSFLLLLGVISLNSHELSQIF